MKTKIAAAAVAGALALTGTAAVAEAAPTSAPTAAPTSAPTAAPTSAPTAASSERVNEGYLSSLPWSTQRTIINTLGVSSLVMGLVTVIAGAFGVELTWPGDPHHARI